MLTLSSLFHGVRRFANLANALQKPKSATRVSCDWLGFEPLEPRVMLTTVTGISSLSAHASIAVGAGATPGTDAVRLVSSGPLPYDGSNASTWSTVNWVPQTPFTLSQLSTLSASLKGEIGTFGGGSPRFSIYFDWNGDGVLNTSTDPMLNEISGYTHMFVEWGTDSKAFKDMPSYTSYTDTGNFVTTTNRNWDVSQLVPRTTYPYRTLSDAMNQISNRTGSPTVGALIGNLRILQISLVVDGGWSQTNPVTTPALTQQFLIDHVLIEGFIPGSAPTSPGTSDVTSTSVTPNFSELLVATDPPLSGPSVSALSASPDPVVRPNNITLTASGVTDSFGNPIVATQFYRDSNNNGTLEPTADQFLGNGSLSGSDWVWTGSSISFPAGTDRFFVRAKNSLGAFSAPATTTSTVNNPPTSLDAVTGVAALSAHASIASGAGAEPGTDAVRLASQGPLPYDGSNSSYWSTVDWVPQTPFTFSQLLTLKATYKGEIGTFGGGSPRFTIYLDWNNDGALNTSTDPKLDEINGYTHMFVQWGTDSKAFKDVPDYVNYTDTGNFVTSTSKNWDISQLSSGIYPYRIYSDAMNQPSNRTGNPSIGALIGNLRVLQISVVLDGGWAMTSTTPAQTQQLLIDNILIEGFVPTASAAASSPGSGTFGEKLVATVPVPQPPTIASLQANPSPLIRPNDITLTATGVSDPGSHPITGVTFYRDSNHNGTLDLTADQILGSGTPGGGDWNWTGPSANFDAGINRYFAVAQNSLNLSSIPATTTSTITNLNPTILSLSNSPSPTVKGVNQLLTANGVSDADGTIAGVYFFRDVNGNNTIETDTDQILGQGSYVGGGAWSLSADTSNFPAGPVVYMAIARDNDNGLSNTALSTSTVNIAPIVTALAGTPNPVIKGDKLTLAATGVSDPNGTVVAVSFYRDSDNSGDWDSGDTLLGTDTTPTSGWTWGGSSSTFAPGNNRFFARAIDNAGTYSIAPIATTVVYVNARPVIGTLSVSPNPVLLGNNVTLTASSVTDADGSVARVEFYRDTNNNGTLDLTADQFLGVDVDGSDGWKAVASTGGYPVGSVKYLARAQDNLGVWSAVKAATGTVNVPPTIASLTATPNPVVKGSTLLLTANGVADTLPGKVVSVSFFRDSNNNGSLDTTDVKLGTDTSGTDGWTWTGSTSTFPLGTGVKLFAIAKDNNNAISTPVSTTIGVVTTLAPAASSPTSSSLSSLLQPSDSTTYKLQEENLFNDLTGQVGTI